MSRSERRWCFFYAGLLAALTSIPYILAYAAQGSEWQFTGFVFGSKDGNSYIAKMLLGVQGDWLFRTPYTVMEQKGVLAFLPYLLLGKLVSGPETHTQLVVLYHLFRLLVIPIGVLATYQFASIFLDDARWRRMVTILATVGGGLGWLVLLSGGTPWLGSQPLEFISPESFGFLAYYGLPHLVLARALLLLALADYLRSTDDPKRVWRAGLWLLVLTLVQPLSVLTAYALLAVHLILVLIRARLRRRLEQVRVWISAALKTVILSLPVVLYLVVVFTQDPYVRVWTSQNRILSPHPAHYLLAYGFFALPALYGSWAIARTGEDKVLLPLGWLLVFPVLAYFPHNLQRRLPEGVWVAIVILAILGLNEWIREPQRRRAIATALLLTALPSSLILLAGGVQASENPKEPTFRPQAEIDAFEWIGLTAESNAVVLGSFETGNPLPAFAPVRVLIGHGPESAFLDDLEPRVTEFYSLDGPEQAKADFIAEMNIQFVFFGPNERDLGEWEPGEADFLDLVFEKDDYQVFRVEGLP